MLDHPELRALLRTGDVVVARPAGGGRSRIFTGLAHVDKPCTAVRAVLADPRRYPEVYPLVEEVRVLRRDRSAIEYEMDISIGAGSATQRMRLEQLPDGVLQSIQGAGRSTWHLFPTDPEACLLHFTHDEDLTRDSVMLRMALSGKDPIKQGIQAAAAVGNVRNVRRHFDPGARPPPPDEHAAGRVLASLALEGTAAFLPHHAGRRPLVAARAGADAERALAEAGASEGWGRYIELFSGEQAAVRADGRRRMRYTLVSIFEDVDFETWQHRSDGKVEEQIVGGELSSGGWVWRTVKDTRGAALLLAMQLDVAEGDWLVEKLAAIDPIAKEGTRLGVAFMLVEQVAARAAARTP